ncbi:nucleotide disphospho-sugar-binding domain-containing protein [Saccharopolyspora rosea]|uniref:Nucleotide disphospho-sugar-binding domain-containing protein n=1 Tax=Saccharopolyspora rosea TaxID=524884 RepID=A0ABW3FXQ2_9PSEU|nr:nucleotide disphospho-sugar-binding domain-containing protein [Saccharopolyspora rosea]
MRVLFAVYPAPAHLMSVVSYAWALQSAGHEVCVGFPASEASGITTGDFAGVVTAAGLTAAPCGDPEPLAVFSGAHPELVPTMEESERFVRLLGIDAAERDHWDCFYHFMLFFVRNYHPPKPRRDVEQLIAFARDWRPDLVVWDHWFPCAAVAARACGAAHARVLQAPDYSGWFAERRARAGARVADPLAETLRPLADAHGVEVDDELLFGQWTIDPMPESMRLTSSVRTLPVRYVPHNGATRLPGWLVETPRRPRLVISFGVSNRNYQRGDRGRTAKLLEAVSEVDAEVVATLNADQLSEVAGGLPDNVRAHDFLPLTHLLPTASAVVHHGAPATLSVASAKGVPQLVADTDEPTRFVGRPTADGIEWDLVGERTLTSRLAAKYVTDHGAGLRLDHQAHSVGEIRDRLRRVLDEPSFRTGAGLLRRKWLAEPSVAELVPVLERMTEQHRARSSCGRVGGGHGG